MQTIKERRVGLCMTQGELAAKVGVKKSSVCQWEHGGGVGLRHRKVLMEVLGIGHWSELEVKNGKRK